MGSRRLSAKNVKLLRTTLFNYIATREEREKYSAELFDMIQSGKLKVNIHKEYKLETESVKQAFADIKSRQTTGKLVVKI